MSTLTHGYSRTSVYHIWQGMKSRCSDVNHISYKNYGAKGVTVCDRWKDSFEAFLEDMGDRPTDKMIDRIDSKGNYDPSNCRWVTRTEQNNNRSNNKNLTYKDKTMTLKQWSREVGIGYQTLRRRYNLGWDTERLLTTQPVVGRNQYA